MDNCTVLSKRSVQLFLPLLSRLFFNIATSLLYEVAHSGCAEVVMVVKINNPCGVCLRDVTDGLKCAGDCCRSGDCAKISMAEYDRLTTDGNLMWYCYWADCEDVNKKPINTLLSQNDWLCITVIRALQ